MTALLPEAVRTELEQTLDGLGVTAPRLVVAEAVTGGCIHRAARVTTEGGRSFFVKWNEARHGGLFSAEADGLEALRAVAGRLLVPEPLAWSDDASGERAWILMDYVPHEAAGPVYGRSLGEALATMHGSSPPDGARWFGWRIDNWIGTLLQCNPKTASWGAFWRDARLAPQLATARRSGRLSQAVFDEVLQATERALAHVIGPSLLHGDLWSGNAFASTGGRPVLVDPAVYLGDAEVDLAMAELFGGFGHGFFDAYHEARPATHAYSNHARDLYQLYYLLVHVNLFGDAYVAGAVRAAERVQAALS